jgi:hypothetical protein
MIFPFKPPFTVGVPFPRLITRGYSLIIVLLITWSSHYIILPSATTASGKEVLFARTGLQGNEWTVENIVFTCIYTISISAWLGWAMLHNRILPGISRKPRLLLLEKTHVDQGDGSNQQEKHHRGHGVIASGLVLVRSWRFMTPNISHSFL